jgi:DNA polymerase-3 subunit gamma/tau
MSQATLLGEQPQSNATTTQALARKWRPRSFEQMVGQEHVVRALSNALQQNRLHHAYLLTGTRGVGKTTLARVVAKALNCETGITATPCGICSSCTEIDGGRFVDLIELDAASNTQVDSMRELLENALYMPTRGRFKVYIIDEVHMLSRSAFNAMLKTLEEPPAHVKFILATTDPQKVPVTVLSRCLQFNLKQIPARQIRDRLEHILGQESVQFEPVALDRIARAAQGSLRDALSLLDQAIAHGGGQVAEESVRSMLGAVDRSYLHSVVEALAQADGQRLLALADEMSERSLSFEAALQDLAGLLHRIALAQMVPAALDSDDPERDAILALGATMAPEDVQLYYQIALQGRTDFAVAPDDYAAFTMPLLRMLAFAPEGSGQTRAGSPPVPPRQSPAQSQTTSKAPPAQRAAAVSAREPGAVSMPASSQPATQRPAANSHQQEAPIALIAQNVPAPPAQKNQTQAIQDSPSSAAQSIPAPAQNSSAAPANSSTAPTQDLDWHDLVGKLKLGGMARMLAQHSELMSHDADRMELRVPEAHRHLLEKPYRDKLQGAVEEHFGRRVRLDFTLGEATGNTPAERADQERQIRQRGAIEAIDQDPFVRELVENFDARVIDESIRPLDGDAAHDGTPRVEAQPGAVDPR